MTPEERVESLVAFTDKLNLSDRDRRTAELIADACLKVTAKMLAKNGADHADNCAGAGMAIALKSFVDARDGGRVIQ